jgi:hypothetical protein
VRVEIPVVEIDGVDRARIDRQLRFGPAALRRAALPASCRRENRK